MSLVLRKLIINCNTIIVACSAYLRSYIDKEYLKNKIIWVQISQVCIVERKAKHLTMCMRVGPSKNKT